jgi:hypothetical protein
MATVGDGFDAPAGGILAHDPKLESQTKTNERETKAKP